MTLATQQTYRLTQYAHGGGCACKIPPGELEQTLAGLTPWTSPDLVVGLETGDDAAVVRIEGGRAVVSTTDFFTAVVDDAYDFGRIAAANALSDIYAMGATPLVALNLVGWPRDVLPMELLGEVLRGGMDVGREAQVHVAGGQSIDDPEPKYGMAVTGIADPDRLLRNDAARPGLPVSLTKPLGIGVLNNRHKATGEVFPQAVESMTRLNRAASEAALAAGVRAATDVTGFGLLGHAYKMARASGRDDPARRRGRALPRRRPRGARATASSAAAPGATWTGSAPSSTPGWTRTSCCCWPTRRPAAACSSSARSPAPPSSARWWRRAARRSSSADGGG